MSSMVGSLDVGGGDSAFVPVSRGTWQDLRRALKRDRAALLGAAFLVMLVLGPLGARPSRHI